jgi:hypothetical protein
LQKEDAAYVEEAYRDNDVEMTDAETSDEDEEDAVEDALGSEDDDGTRSDNLLNID